MLLSKKTRNLVGLDIGSTSVKLVELGFSKGGYRLKRFAMSTLPPDIIVDRAVMDSSTLVETIKELFNKNRVKNRNVAISVSGFSVYTRRATMSFMLEEELAASIQWEAAQYIPFDIDEVNIDFQILGQNPNNPDQMDVLLVAAKKEYINDFEDLMVESGLELHVIDYDSFAVENMYESLFGIEENEVVALVDIGASLLKVNMIKGPISLLTREVSMGGKQVTEDIQKSYDLQYEEAEALKLSPPEERENYPNFDRIFKNACEIFTMEIQRSLDFFSANFPDEQVQQIGLCGGAAMTPGLVQHVKERTGIDTQLINPFERMSFSSREYSEEYLRSLGPQAAVGVGLAMRRTGER
jgi:type IV pilus assembly protein PilM